MRKVASATLAALLLLAGCHQRTDAELERVVKRYDQLLAEGYRTLNMNPLQEVTTPEQGMKAYYHMAAIGEGRLRLEATLQKLEFTKVQRRGGDKARVETRETWDYRHVEMATGKVFSEERGFVYEMGYDLALQDGAWKIVDITTDSGVSTHTMVPWPKIDRQGTQNRGPAGAKP